MCVIIHQPRGAYLSKDHARAAWKRNPDGGGFAFINPETETVQTEKFMVFEEFWSKFEQMRSTYRPQDFLVHFRIATHGTVDLNNVHPYRVDSHTWMAHNGILHNVPDYKDGRSDTKVFVDEVLPELPEDWLDKPYLVAMVEDFIGYSKLMFITTNPALEHRVYRLNPVLWSKENGLYMTNRAHIATVKKDNKKDNKKSKAPAKVYTPTDYSKAWEAAKKKTDGEMAIARYYGTSDEQPLSVLNNARNSELGKQVLRRERLAIGLDQPFYWAHGIAEYVCMGCLEPLGETGFCCCYDMYCKNCNKLAVECKCSIDLKEITEIPQDDHGLLSRLYAETMQRLDQS